MLRLTALLLLATNASGLGLCSPAHRTRRRTSATMAMQWQSALGSADADWRTALSTTLANLTTSEEETSLALLFVSQAHASHLREACSEVVQALSPEVLVAVVGAGVAGAGSELEGEPVFSILAGALPEDTALRPFLMTTDSMPNWPSLGDSVPEGSRPSFLLFADPYSPIVQAVNCLDDAFPASVVAGGLSCPTSESGPSLALYTRGAQPRVLPSGSVLGLVLGGPRLEVHTACAQGASPVGPTFTVTAGQDNLVEALDGVPALERLQQVAQEAASSDERLLRLLQRALLVGLPVRAGDGVDDFLIRQVVGATPDGGLVLGGERVVAGETQLRFFVRDEIASDADLRLVLDRCAPRPPCPPRLRLPRLPPRPMRPTPAVVRADRVARQFSGRFPSSSAAPAAPLATVLFSCNGRGTNMYSEPDHDTQQFQQSVADSPLGGFFCNGEIGAPGACLPAPSGNGEPVPFRTHLHAFTSVFAMLYEMPEE